MNTAITNPLIKILLCLRRMAVAGCPFPACLGILSSWTRDSIAERNRAAEKALAIDDPLEHSDLVARLRALAEESTRNDRPAVRRQMRQAVDDLATQLAEIHARTEAQAAALRIQLPLGLEK